MFTIQNRNYRIGTVLHFGYAQPYGGDTPRYGKIVNAMSMNNIERNILNRRSKYRKNELLRGTFKRAGDIMLVEHVDGTVRKYYTDRSLAYRTGSVFMFRILQWLKGTK
jgi:hypothetical protein